MNRYLKIGLAAAAVVVIAVVAFNLLPGSPAPGGEPSATATQQPSPSSAPAAAFPPAGPMAIGRHSMTLAGVPLSIEIPSAGWSSDGEHGIFKGDLSSPDSAGFILWPESAADNTFADPCTKTSLDPPAGPSAAELAAAVAAVPGMELVSGPSEVTVGGYPAQHVVLTVPEDIGCAPNSFYLWEDLDYPVARYATELGSTYYVWIIDVDGTIVWIDGETFAASGPDAAQEVRQIVNSIQFE